MTDRPLLGGFEILSADSLNCQIRGTWFEINNISVKIPSKKFVLPASTAEIFIFLNPNTKEIEQNSTGWPAVCHRLYKLATNTDSITNQEDFRTAGRFSRHSSPATHDEWLIDGNTNSNINWGIFDLDTVSSLIIPEGVTGFDALMVVNDSGTPGANVFMSIRKPGETAVSQERRAYPQEQGVPIGFNFPVGMSDDHEIERMVKVSETFQYKLGLLEWKWGR